MADRMTLLELNGTKGLGIAALLILGAPLVQHGEAQRAYTIEFAAMATGVKYRASYTCPEDKSHSTFEHLGRSFIGSDWMRFAAKDDTDAHDFAQSKRGECSVSSVQRSRSHLERTLRRSKIDGWTTI